MSVPTRQARLQTLAACVLVALASGCCVNLDGRQVYSAYAPQLGHKLNLNHTQLNVIGIAGNIGVYFFAPISGWIVDRRGPKIPLFVASALLFLGYGGISFLFSNTIPQVNIPNSWPLTPLVSALTLCSFATGVAGSAGIISAMNAGVRVTEDKYHASATGGINSAFGLSAFFFSTLARELFPGRTGAFLTVLCLGTGSAVLLGAILVRPPPLGPIHLETEEDGENQEREEESEREEERRPFWTEHTPLRTGTVDESILYGEQNPWASQAATPNASGAATPNTNGSRIDKAEDVHGIALFTSLDFLIIFGIVGLLGGPGLMYINNVGSIVQALFASAGEGWSRREAEKAQASQVGIISVCSFVGRFVIGFLADHLSHNHTIPRTSCLLLSATIGIVAISLLLNVTDVSRLWYVSGLWGISYGTVFALFPALVLERFGMPHFAQNAGLMGIAAKKALFGNVYNYTFGRNFDNHSQPAFLEPVEPVEPVGEGLICLEGRGAISQVSMLHWAKWSRPPHLDICEWTNSSNVSNNYFFLEVRTAHFGRMSSRGIQFPNSVDRSGAGRFITFVLDCESWGYKFTLAGLAIVQPNVDLSQQHVKPPRSSGFYAANSSAAVSFDQHSLLLDGKRIMVFRGEFHPLRLPSTAPWRDVLEKMKPAGFDAVSIYFHWRLSESKRANLNFEGYLSVTRFLEIAKDVGILVIVRPGPYINAETTGGGYPGWLTNVPDTARSNGSDFTPAWKPYIRAVSEYTAPYQYPDGSVILDKTTYWHTDRMKWVIEEMRSSGITRVPITHNDRKPDGQFASGPAKVDLYAWDAYPLGFDCSNPDVGPDYEECYKLINEQVYSASGNKIGIVADSLVQFANVFYKNNYAAGTYLQNLYMTYGGTNWGSLTTPTVYTSYDYTKPVSEDRSFTAKYSEIKLQALFLHGTPHYHLAGRISTDATHASLNYIWTTHLATPKGQNLYIIRQTSTTRTGRAEFDFKVNTTAGEVVLHSAALNGRESKIIVSEYPFGNILLAYSITALHTSSTSKPIVSGSSSVTASISNGTALISGVPLSNGLVRVAVGNTSVPRTGSVLVFGPYLARNATINGSTLDITGDAQSATTSELEVLAPSVIEHVTFDGQPVTVSKSTTGTLKGSIRKCTDSLPEVALDFDDPEWITADKTLTLRPARFRPLAGKTVLYSGHVVYRGRFERNATGVRLFVQGLQFRVLHFLNGQFLGSGQGRAATDPAGQLDLICDVYLFRSCGQRGECGYCCDRQHGIGARLDFGRCLRGWTFNELSNFVDGKARLPVGFVGTVDGEDTRDTLRGPMNQGELYTERTGAIYSHYSTTSWNSTGCSPSAGITLDRAGTTAYKTKLTLDIDKHADVPLAFRFERTLGKSYRVMVYVNEWQFGKFVSNFGPQTVYPVPEGILDHRGENDVVLVLWSLDGAGAKVANVELIATNVLFSSKEVINGLVN
ncbi:glycoside hydrolase family 35 protein [Rhizoctonia solani]|uniref:beta-galactosidase n=1 Tax=Rhizoctonia solani TaxID=456999 RepID=A0A8H8SWN4_9AGAM|nr:glycoside hydrolase family 35 protein [Rhizoctonia solani]QRW20549.1 glycoside hydrolase family 35 protein [Rhizoctonia solani]